MSLIELVAFLAFLIAIPLFAYVLSTDVSDLIEDEEDVDR